MAESSAQTFPESISTHVNIPFGSDASQEIAFPMISGYPSSHVSMRRVRKMHGLMRLIPLVCLSGQQLSSTFCRKILNNAFILTREQESGVGRLVALHSYPVISAWWISRNRNFVLIYDLAYSLHPSKHCRVAT